MGKVPKDVIDQVKKVESHSQDALYLNNVDIDELISYGLFGKKIRHLKKLIILFSKINGFPDFISDLKDLEILNLQGNQIRMIPEFLGELASLRLLGLGGNNFKELPDSISNLKELKHIGLDYLRDLNLKNTVHKLKYLTQLESLSISCYVTFPIEICELAQLKKLFLTHPEDNSIHIPSEISQLINLEYLGLSDLSLKNLPESIGELKKLRHLNIARNQITYLPDSLLNLPHFEILDITKNPIAQEPNDAQEQYLREYFINGTYEGPPIYNDYLKLLKMEMPNLDIIF